MTLSGRLRRTSFLLAGMVLPAVAAPAVARAVPTVLAAEAVYADVARQIGGAALPVRSVLNNPAADPHLFELTPAVARAAASADIVVLNGLGYDPWMERLLQASGPSPDRTTVVVARLVHREDGENPHLWYDPDAIGAYARTLSELLAVRDPANAGIYRDGLARFQASMSPLLGRIADLRARLNGTLVAATEPVFGPMASALGLSMRDEGFALAVMNGTEPAPAVVSALESDLRAHRVRLLFFNSQVTTGTATRLLGVAKQAGVPAVGVSETEPARLDYQHWMMSTLDAVDRALRTP